MRPAHLSAPRRSPAGSASASGHAARPGRGRATVGPFAHAGGRPGWPAERFDPVAPGTAVDAATFLFWYDHRALFPLRMNPDMADPLPVDEGRPDRGMTGAA
ncbi:hypothetical protein ACGFH8_07315 [Micromonospora sp. NPDC049175]|uniref:hypothetical protein n=1 Tax=Micromonospora sp. NPDC049175 TaxID=3364266 RepID=UPI00371F1B53